MRTKVHIVHLETDLISLVESIWRHLVMADHCSLLVSVRMVNNHLWILQANKQQTNLRQTVPNHTSNLHIIDLKSKQLEHLKMLRKNVSNSRTDELTIKIVCSITYTRMLTIINKEDMERQVFDLLKQNHLLKPNEKIKRTLESSGVSSPHRMHDHRTRSCRAKPCSECTRAVLNLNQEV